MQNTTYEYVLLQLLLLAMPLRKHNMPHSKNSHKETWHKNLLFLPDNLTTLVPFSLLFGPLTWYFNEQDQHTETILFLYQLFDLLIMSILLINLPMISNQSIN